MNTDLIAAITAQENSADYPEEYGTLTDAGRRFQVVATVTEHYRDRDRYMCERTDVDNMRTLDADSLEGLYEKIGNFIAVESTVHKPDSQGGYQTVDFDDIVEVVSVRKFSDEIVKHTENYKNWLETRRLAEEAAAEKVRQAAADAEVIQRNIDEAELKRLKEKLGQ